MLVLVPAVVALIGLLATFFVIRTRYRVKRSLYTSLRASRARQIEEARRRAMVAGPAPEEGAPEAEVAGETALEATFGMISLVAALGLVLLGILLAIGSRT